MLTPCALFAALFVAAAPPESPFPFRAVHVTPEAIDLAPDAAGIERLAGLVEARLTGIPWPGGGEVTATVSRVEVPVGPRAFHVDGRWTGTDPTAALTAWRGRVDGEDSDLYLAFSPHGSWGWIDARGERLHLIGDAAGGARLVTEAWATVHRGERPMVCGADSPPGPVVEVASGGPTFVGTTGPTLLKTRLALETDFHFFQLFGDPLATATYAAAVIGAANSRYREQADVVLVIDYLGVHTNPNDGWTQTDVGGDCYAVIAEFKAQWGGGGAPVPADLFHMFTAADTGCAIASGKICDAGGAFSMTGRMDGLSPFPPAPGPLNWDFVWFCHETGHNFGSPHTHQYCPPIDECAPAGYFGPCQTQKVCITNATFMSYCHSCPGGLANYTTWFHPTVVGVMRAQAESGCLAPFAGVFTQSLGNGLFGSNGVPALTITYSDGPDVLHLDVVSAPKSQQGAFISGPTAAYQPFLGGGTLVPSLSVVVSTATDASGNVALAVPVSASVPDGVTLFTQAWFFDPAGPNGFAATNGLEWEYVHP